MQLTVDQRSIHIKPETFKLENALERTILSWSGGKDSALSLYELKSSLGQRFDVSRILTTLTESHDRISMHGVRKQLLEAQAMSLGIPLQEVWIPPNASNEIYEERMAEALKKCLVEGVSKVAFGDLFLQDIRQYREKFLEKLGIKCLFPIWGKDTKKLAEYFVDSGFKAIVCCVDSRKLGKEYCGREYDKKFISELPKSVDKCGENGEFHTFVYDGPVFKKRIDMRVGETVERSGFYFTDITSN